MTTKLLFYEGSFVFHVAKTTQVYIDLQARGYFQAKTESFSKTLFNVPADVYFR